MALSLRRKGRVENAKEILITSKALVAQIVEMKVAKNKTKFMAHVRKDKIFNPLKKSDVIVS